MQEVEEAWAVLSAAAAVPEGGYLTRISPWTYRGDAVLLGRDQSSLRHLLIPIDDREQCVADRASAGVQLLERRLVAGGHLRRYLDLVCHKPDLNEYFSIIITEVVSVLRAPGRADQAIHRILTRWRELLGSERSGALSPEALTGLFAELCVLLELADHGPAVANAWVGPEGERHDIVMPAGSIEVKGTRSRTGRRVEIHGVEQLEPPESGELYLAYVRLERDPNGRSVLDLVAELEGRGCSSQTLRAGLLRIGLTSENEEAVSAFRLIVRERLTYEVGSEFPRIVRASFAEGRVPPGVISTNYVIDLTTEPPVPMSETQWSEIGATLAGSVT